MGGDQSLMANLFSRLVSTLRGSSGNQPAPVVSSNGSGWGWLNSMPQSTIDYEGALRGKMHLNSLVATGVDYIGSNVAASPLIVQRQKESEQGALWNTVPGHALTLLAEQPNEGYTWSTLIWAMLFSWVTEGNVYLLAWPKLDGSLGQLYYLPHHMVEIMDDEMSSVAAKQDGSKLVTYYRYYQPGGVYVDFAPEMVIHLRRGLNPNDMRYGWSPLKSTVKEVFGDNVAATYTSSLIDNSAVPSVIISPESRAGQPMISESDARSITVSLRNALSREGAGKPVFIPKGVNASTIAYSPKDLELGALADRLVSRICAAMGLDPMVLGLPSANKTYSNLAEAQDGAFSRTITPAKRQIAEQLTVAILRRKMNEKNTRVWWDDSGVDALQDDRAETALMAVNLFEKGVITQAQALEMVGLPFGPENERYFSEVMAMGTTSQGPDQAETPENEINKTVAQRLRLLSLHGARRQTED